MYTETEVDLRTNTLTFQQKVHFPFYKNQALQHFYQTQGAVHSRNIALHNKTTKKPAK